jgi:hypothetical protein
MIPIDAVPITVQEAISLMEKGLCPQCGNGGGRAAIRWLFSYDPQWLNASTNERLLTGLSLNNPKEGSYDERRDTEE